eukprot:1734736-Pleurochrysis_carterae.AAC.2
MWVVCPASICESPACPFRRMPDIPARPRPKSRQARGEMTHKETLFSLSLEQRVPAENQP